MKRCIRLLVPVLSVFSLAIPAMAQTIVMQGRNTFLDNTYSNPLASKSLIIDMSADGYFYADADVNNTHLQFIVDSGASIVALTLKDAQTIGFGANSLNFNMKGETPNGPVTAAAVVLPSLTVGTITLKNVEAVVIKGDMPSSLLGMSFLSRLSKMEMSGNQLTLFP